MSSSECSNVSISPAKLRDPDKLLIDRSGKRILQQFVPILLVLFPIIFSSTFLPAAVIQGKIISASQNEPLARVEVSVLETKHRTITQNDGSFVLNDIPPGEYTVQLNAVGYRLLTIHLSLTPDEAAKELEITLAPDNFRRTEKVVVKGDIFQNADSPAIYESNLTPTEERETATVLANDPFRSIQSLPGVSASGNNDFLAQFSVMGAPYENIGIYVDDILIPSPFHGLDITEGATLSIFTSETLEDIKLLPAAYPEKYGDAIGAALSLRTRDGSRTAPIFRASIGLADSEMLGEGKLGSAGRGSWIASARKSYLSYLFRNRLNDTSDDVSFYDADLKLVYDITHNQSLNFYGVGGHTSYELIHPSTPATDNTIARATDDFMMGRLGWRWTANPRLVIEEHGAYFQQPNGYSNPYHQPLHNGHHAEYAGGGSLTWSWQRDHVLEVGWMARRVNDAVQSIQYFQNSAEGGESGGAGWKNDEYLQQASSLFGNRLHITGGLRLDTAEMFDRHPVSPQVSTALQVAPSTQLQIGYGRYNQFTFPVDTPFVISSGCSIKQESLSTANHYIAGLEQRIGETTRAKIMFFDRQNTESFAMSASDGCPASFSTSGFLTTEHDYSRGAQIVLQSRTANRLSGWIGYTLAYARQQYVAANLARSPYLPTLNDQRHTVNTFANYRVSPTVNIGGKFLFGSGFPIPGSSSPTIRLGNYQRLDLRAEKDWAFTRWKLALYGEVLNLTNHNNPRYFYSSSNADGSFTVTSGQGLPITPTASVAFEF